MSLIAMEFSSLLPGLLRHLWQSTEFCLLIAALSFALRQNEARIRFRLWLLASLKFMIPFALLVVAGEHLRPVHSIATVPPAFSMVMEGAGGQIEALASPVAISQSKWAVLVSAMLPWLPVVWLVGVVALSVLWLYRWQTLRNIVRNGTRLPSGDLDMQVVSTPARLEPGVFGIVRPVLLLPEGIWERLTARQMDAVIAHELCHVRRRDNLSAALHMAVQILFWFHPCVWWIGARMMEEREAACDAAVLAQSNNDSLEYAEGILQICRLYAEPAVAGFAGVTGADLKRRVMRIATGQFGQRLGAGQRLLLSVAAGVCVGAPLSYGLLHPPAVHAAVELLRPQLQENLHAAIAVFTAANEMPAGSVTEPAKRAQIAAPVLGFGLVTIQKSNPYPLGRAFHVSADRFQTRNTTLTDLLSFAYDMQRHQVMDGPRWMDVERYDVDARLPDSLPLTDFRLKAMLRQLLAERFGVRLHTGQQNLPVYVLNVAQGGVHLTRNETDPNGLPGMGQVRPGLFMARNASIMDFCHAMEIGVLDRPVIDQTGLQGRWDFSLNWQPDLSMYDAAGFQPPTGFSYERSPQIVEAMEEQMGLRLNATTMALSVLVMERADRPELH